MGIGQVAEPALAVIRPGTLTTVQDLGRLGYQRFGLPPAGAMDGFALQVANLLVGNERGAAGLETAWGGLAVRALRDLVVALCGADLDCEFGIGNSEFGRQQRPALWTSFLFRKGQELVWRRPLRGAWAYLAVAGGVAVAPALGSRSTYLRAALGGLAGRGLRKGDVLAAGPAAGAASGREGRCLPPGDVPDYASPATVRVVLGPQDEAFTPQAIATFLSAGFELTARSDRMGYRLAGPPLAHRRGADILSDAVAAGAIQVPADGQPIVLLADRPTTGGYAKIATVISVDLPRIAQLRPGDKVLFRAVDVEAAQALASRREQLLARLQARWK